MCNKAFVVSFSGDLSGHALIMAPTQTKAALILEESKLYDPYFVICSIKRSPEADRFAVGKEPHFVNHHKAWYIAGMPEPRGSKNSCLSCKRYQFNGFPESDLNRVGVCLGCSERLRSESTQTRLPYVQSGAR